MMFISWLALIGAHAQPYRAPSMRMLDLEADIGRNEHALVIKLTESSGVSWQGGQPVGLEPELAALLSSARPLFSRSMDVLRADRRTFDPAQQLADLTLYLQMDTPDAVQRGKQLQAFPQVECVYLDFLAVPPPADLAPKTPDFSDLQAYTHAAPDGFGLAEAIHWPGGDGSNVTIADVEYGWEPAHEDLDMAPSMVAWGWNSGLYDYHGTAVLGQLIAGDNGYGVTGMTPGAEMVVISPYEAENRYNIAAAIDAAAALLDAGDVLLIEQQAYAGGNFVPVSISPAVFDVIALAVAKGIVVIEPGGNGAQDLDDPYFEGWFDRSIRDSGAIMVGGGASPLSGYRTRDWYPSGSSYGQRVDVQGWYDNIVTTAGSSMADLFSASDDLQGYTTYFGGTSGASPMVAAVAVIANSIAWEVHGTPWDPWDLRTAMVSTGTPQDNRSGAHIGPQPDLRRLLWTWGTR